MSAAMILHGCLTRRTKAKRRGGPPPVAYLSSFRLTAKFAAIGAACLLASCAGGQREVATPSEIREAPTNAVELPLRAGPDIAHLGLLPRDSAAALDAFEASCHVATAREDRSGLTRPMDWQPSCRSAASWPRDQAASFFSGFFETAIIGDGQAFATGYFEPEIMGSRTRRAGFDVPVYATPSDLGARRDTGGNLIAYYDRSEIEDGALSGRGLEIAWAADEVEFFFLQIQGSGRIRTPEGEVIRIGYDGQNGHAYTGIGRVMRDRGLLGDGPGQYAGSMQGIMQYIRENPEDGRDLMRMNASWIFFRELEGDGPIGSIGVAVRGRSSVAVDPLFVPYGAPVFLSTDRTEPRGMWVAQDTGGAIKGANRFDTFWGAGQEARETAGGMSARGTSWIFLPKGTLNRLGVR